MFVTAMATCDEAIAEGSRMAIASGQATELGAVIAFSVTCSSIQMQSATTTHFQSTIDFAVALSDSGVCPGDPGMLRLI